jgi:DNA-binding MarR family transcriptional regulator
MVRTFLLNRSPVHLLHRAAQCAEQVFQTVVAYELTPRQFAVLTAVSQQQGATQTAIVQSTGIDRSTLAEMLRRLVRRGLVRRRRKGTDKRAYAVALTDQGRRILRATDPLMSAVDASVLEALSKTQQDRFLKSLSTIVSALQRVEGAPSPRRRHGF